ncbi:MAG: TIGR02186 family protein, partial [Deltaproteobacteria bacterium]|nr:TIGR02186 family protein [Deltaproteobacteria bacterium]
MIRNRIWISIIIITMFFMSHPQPAGSTVSVKMKHEPNLITIGALFNGTQLTVSGKVAAENEVVVIVSGKQEELTLKKKGKALGLLWMNLGDVHFKKVPNLYLLYCSKGMMELAASEPKTWEQLGIGFESLKKEMEIEVPQAERDDLAQEFLKLKQNQGLYASRPGEISFGQKSGTEKSFKTAVWIPPRILPGEYQVQVMEIHNGIIEGSSVDRLKVKEQGIPSMISSMAFNHSLFYGFFAVLIAVSAGLVMDFFF